MTDMRFIVKILLYIGLALALSSASKPVQDVHTCMAQSISLGSCQSDEDVLACCDGAILGDRGYIASSSASRYTGKNRTQSTSLRTLGQSRIVYAQQKQATCAVRYGRYLGERLSVGMYSAQRYIYSIRHLLI